MSDINEPYAEAPLPEERIAGDVDPEDPVASTHPIADEEAALHTDELLPEIGEESWEPPDAPSTPLREGGFEDVETLDDRLRQEEPDPDPYAEPDPSTEV